MHQIRLALLAVLVGLAPARAAERTSVRLDQPVQEYFTSFGPDADPIDRGTYGT